MAELWCWRHPRATGAAGRCIGRTDLPVDPRKAKRLAHRIRQAARRHALPRVVTVSPLRRARDVGLWLRRWGWRLQVDARLAEMDFGAWDGLRWAQIPWEEVRAWESDLLHHAPGGGEPLAQLMRRVRGLADEHAAATALPGLVVTHGGWVNAWRHGPRGGSPVDPATWPPAPPHGGLTRGPAHG